MSDLSHTGRRRTLRAIAAISMCWFVKSAWAGRAQPTPSR